MEKTVLTTRPFIPPGIDHIVSEAKLHQSFACCVLPLIPLRAEPTEKSEQVTQVLHGQLLMILTHQEAWALVRVLDDGYEGWCATKQLHLLASEEALHLFESPRVLTVPPTCSCKTLDGRAILPAGSRLLPGEQVIDKGITDEQRDPVSLAMSFLQTPYLWGGKSVMGMDCSGLIQVVFALCGLLLPRDASQQVSMGTRVPHLGMAGRGDLAFFQNEAGAVVHVGLLLDGERIVHASGCVHIDRWDEHGIYKEGSATYTHQLQQVRRVQG